MALCSRLITDQENSIAFTVSARSIIALVGMATLLAWAWALVYMGDMDYGPGTDLHSLPVFLICWVVMLTAMMLPSELNYLAALNGLIKANRHSNAQFWTILMAFLAGYGIAWTLYGMIAFGCDHLIRQADVGFLAWDRGGPFVAGSVLVVAGCYQLSALKDVCLTHCRSPLSYFARHWQPGLTGGLYMGARHGMYCVACCWALMMVMFAVGAMNLVWMAFLTVLMFAEKVFTSGHLVVWPTALLFIVLGIWLAVSPASFPFLVDPAVVDKDVMHHHHHPL